MDFKTLSIEVDEREYNGNFAYYYVFKMFYIFAHTYDSNSESAMLKKDAFDTCIKSVFDLLSNVNFTINLQDIKMPKVYSSQELKNFVNTVYAKVRANRSVDYPSLKIKLDKKGDLYKEEWAYPTWYSFHFLTTLIRSESKYLPEDIERYSLFLSSLAVLMPCPICRNHLSSNLIDSSTLFKSGNNVFYVGFVNNMEVFRGKKDIFIWSIFFHYFVNAHDPNRRELLDPNLLKNISRYAALYDMQN